MADTLSCNEPRVEEQTQWSDSYGKLAADKNVGECRATTGAQGRNRRRADVRSYVD
jgi:hypothetical protein